MKRCRRSLPILSLQALYSDDLSQWDRCLSNLAVKSSLGLGFGIVLSVLLFKRRAWPAWVGVGFGAGRAYEECNWSLKQAAKDIRKQG
jgi:MICOS complex subunit MIC10